MSQINKGIFREYDIRGIVGTDLTEDTVKLIGQASGKLYRDKGVKKISVGYDVRPSSEWIKQALIQALCGCGVSVVDIGYVPTPVAYFTMHTMDVGGNIMITASHNPAEYNGFKVGINRECVFGAGIRQLYDFIEKGQFPTGKGTVESFDATKGYIEYMMKHFKFKKKLKVVVDAANATAALFVHTMFKKMGHDVTELFCTVDGTFPNHHPDPTVEKNIVDLKKKVIEVKADVGFGFDGDSDRLGVVDDKGRNIPGDILLLIYAQEVLRENPGASIVYEVKSSKAMEEMIPKFGGKPVMWKTGHSLIEEKMHETKAPLAGEVSGHIFFAHRYFGYDDAIYAALRMMEILSYAEKPLSAMRDKLPDYPVTPEIRLEVATDEIKVEIVEKMKKYFKTKYKTIDIDGIRIVFPRGWGLIRTSNTQPVIGMRFEADTPELLAEYKNTVFAKLKEFGAPV